MNYFQFAIASIVDANTGNGLVHGGTRIHCAASAAHGRRIRSRSLTALLGAIKDRLSTATESIRARHAEKRRIGRLAALNDHILEDIGITRGDVIGLQLGQIDLQQLEAKRSVNRATTRKQHPAVIQRVGDKVRLNALNEAVFARAKCA
jgi:uncharacterized protein YjiS (DUF1127 family)